MVGLGGHQSADVDGGVVVVVGREMGDPGVGGGRRHWWVLVMARKGCGFGIGCMALSFRCEAFCLLSLARV